MIIECDQGSPEWLEMRNTKVTASDLSVIMGHNPWSNIQELWKRKVGFLDPIEQNHHMKRGLDLEPFARSLANDQLKEVYKPYVIVSDRYEWAMASLDGINESRSSILEIKCPGKTSHQKVIKSGIPDHYKDQIYWQMLCSETSHGYFFSYNPDCKTKDYCIEVDLDYEYLTKEMIPKAKEFYECMINFKEPGE